MIDRSESHVSEGDIARLIEGSLEGAERDRVVAHLNLCPRCRETYQDSALYVRLFECDSPALVPSGESVLDLHTAVLGELDDDVVAQARILES